jgi:uncharacterized protein YjbJ (UPF0337 family)
MDTAKGRAKEAAGVLTGDETLKAKGKVDQLAGKTKDAVERTVDKVRRIIKGH